VGTYKTTNPVITALSIPRSLTRALPPSITVTLRYFTQVSLDPLAGGATGHIFRANSCYDPDVTGAGHQPLGMDQWFGLYTKGVVVSSRINVKPICINAGDTGVYGACLRNDAVSLIDQNEFIESDKAAYACFFQAFDCNQETVTNFNAKTVFSLKDATDEADLQFSAAADATRLSYYHVFVGSPNTTISLGATLLQVLIEYRIKFMTPKPLSSS